MQLDGHIRPFTEKKEIRRCWVYRSLLESARPTLGFAEVLRRQQFSRNIRLFPGNQEKKKCNPASQEKTDLPEIDEADPEGLGASP